MLTPILPSGLCQKIMVLLTQHFFTEKVLIKNHRDSIAFAVMTRTGKKKISQMLNVAKPGVFRSPVTLAIR